MLLKNFTFLPEPQAPPNPKPLTAEPSGLSHPTRSPKPGGQMSNGERETSTSGPSFQAGHQSQWSCFFQALTQLPQACRPSTQADCSTVRRLAFMHGLLYSLSSHCCPQEEPSQQWNFPSWDQHLFFHVCPDLRLDIPPSPGTEDFPLNRVSVCAQGTMQTPYVGGPFCHPSPPHQGSICECWTQGPGNVPFHTVPKHYCREWKVAGLTFRIKSTAGLWGQGPECLNLCLSRKGASLRTDTIVQGIQPTGWSTSSEPMGVLVHGPCELAHELKDQVLREDMCP